MKGEIIIVRQTDEIGSIGCCGGIPAQYITSKNDMVSVRLMIEDLSNYYQEIKKNFGEGVTIDYVDPRNYPFIGYYLIKHLLKKNISLYHFLKSLFNVRRNVIYCNGYLLNQGKKQKEMNVEAILTEIKNKLAVNANVNHLEKKLF